MNKYWPCPSVCICQIPKINRNPKLVECCHLASQSPPTSSPSPRGEELGRGSNPGGTGQMPARACWAWGCREVGLTGVRLVIQSSSDLILPEGC